MMENDAERFDEILSAMENGRPIEACQAELAGEDAALLGLAAGMRALAPPTRSLDTVLAQLAQVTHAAEAQTAGSPARPVAPQPRPTNSSPLPGLARMVLPAPLAAAGMAFVMLMTCAVLFSFWAGAGRLAGGLFGNLAASKTQVQSSYGLVEQQSGDGRWTPVKAGAWVQTGARIRTGDFSSAVLTLLDGSQVVLGPQSEMVIEHMERAARGQRIIRLTQWKGQTGHTVQTSRHPDSIYEVRTPAGVSAARGTAFSVQIEASGETRVAVSEGLVEVSGQGATVLVQAGYLTTLALVQPPSQPVLLVTGEGILTLADSGVQIAGQPVVLGPAAASADLADGALVSFEGQRLAEGRVQVDTIQVLLPPQRQRFQLTGLVLDAVDTALVISDTVIQINDKSGLAGEISPAQTATVQGVILEDGTWLAEQVYGPGEGQPFSFTGVIQEIATDRWTIAGITVRIGQDSLLDASLAAGDPAQVQGWLNKGVWQAGTISPAGQENAEFHITGPVASIDPWVIQGVGLETHDWSRVDAGIKVNQVTRARGYVLPGGRWVADSIEAVEQQSDQPVSLEFVGTVNSVSPLVVAGIRLEWDDDGSTPLKTGMQVSVRAVRQADGAWLAVQVTPVSPPAQGCVTYATVITAVSGQLVTLQDGSTIHLSLPEKVEGELAAGRLLLVVQCLGADGSITFPLMKVIDEPTGDPLPTATATPTLTPVPLPVSVILPNCYKVTFLGAVNNGDGTSTWRYEVEELPCAQDLSNWVLELPDCARIYAASPAPWERVNPDPNHRLNGIKWQTGSGFKKGEFMVRLSGDLILDVTQIGAKGPDVAITAIAGPACSLGDGTPTSTPIPTETPNSTATLTPTEEASSTATLPPPSPPPPPASSGPITITDNDRTLSVNCAGATVTVNGNNNTITLTGACTSLTVRGNNNRITLPGGVPVMNTGNNNVINQR